MMTKIWTVNGEIDLNAIPEAQLSAKALAPVLAKINRFSGRTRVPWSVAAHSVLVSKFCETPQTRLWALLHDAHEAFIGDITTPAVTFFESKASSELAVEGAILRSKDAIDRQVLSAWGLDLTASDCRAVAYYDRAVLKVEALSFFGVEPEGVDDQLIDCGMEYLACVADDSGVLSATDAEKLYLRELTEAAKAVRCTPPLGHYA